ncbi:Fic family protein [Algoriphagus persicinus]|uniref:Fic family protein n=1 Tax=Algoriphagus persicinus TaxID=3108754 RepID=UPI002B3C3FED|nr:Fic/DOC family N-terminal domain-containing protein [Algoriphagus sp. E1-3-M2]MEB2786313.1 Fic/DOC family N-terminal domain-containing protein [Algoriphagus sp. E1-3-M2]
MPYDRNIPFNDLPLLPVSKEVEEDITVLKKLVTASRALASVNASVLRLPNPTMLVNTIALQEAKSSTAIENIFTTEDELYKAVSDLIQEERADSATKEVLRYREALWEGYATMKDKSRINQEVILGVFREVKNTNAGIRSPATQTIIKRGNSEFRSGETVYTPPRGEKILQDLMENWTEYLGNDTNFPTDPLVKMCISHYQFEAIHPFADGNGRTGRILNQLYLVNKRLLDLPVLYLSKYIIVHKEDYYYHLGAVTQRGDWKSWILFMLEAVEKTSKLTEDLIHEIIVQMEATLAHGKSKIKWYSKEVNELIFSQPYLKSKTLGELMGVSSRTTLTKYFSELAEAKILFPKKDGKEVYYVNEELVRILGD